MGNGRGKASMECLKPEAGLWKIPPIREESCKWRFQFSLVPCLEGRSLLPGIYLILQCTQLYIYYSFSFCFWWKWNEIGCGIITFRAQAIAVQ